MTQNKNKPNQKHVSIITIPTFALGCRSVVTT